MSFSVKISSIGTGSSFEYVELEDPEKTQSEEDDDQSGYYVHYCLMLLHKASEGSCQGAHSHEYDRKSCYEAKSSEKCLLLTSLASACKVGDVNGKHR